LRNHSKLKKNRSQETIAWDRIEAILRKDYPVGQKKEGNKAYNPLLLFKCFRLQKWFHLSSDPELEDSIINDRESFQTFLGVSSVEASLEDSAFSKFRKRLTKGKFDLVGGNIRHQSADQGLTINGRSCDRCQVCKISQSSRRQ